MSVKLLVIDKYLYHPKDLIKATQQDVDDYFDKNEGYTQLEVGENYCGGC